jgi:hypothetical protein
VILRRYGDSMQSVELNFDAKAMTEIGFRRDRELSEPFESFEAAYRQVESWELTAETEGYVQNEVEKELLQQLEAQVRELEGRLGDDEVLVVLSQQGVDYPKTRTEQKTVVEEGENRLYFFLRVEPPLRIARYRRGE